MLRRSSFIELFLIFLPGLGFVSGNVSVRCPVGSRGFGVSLWSYLASGVTCGKVFCGYRPQNKAHLSEPGTHQRTWRVMGRPFHRLPQTLSMTRRNDSPCSPQDTSRVRIVISIHNHTSKSKKQTGNLDQNGHQSAKQYGNS